MASLVSIEPTAVPRVRRDVDITKAGLTVDEGMVAASIDGRTDVKALSIIVRRSLEWTTRILERLTRVGVVIWNEDVHRDARPDILDFERPEYGDFVFPPSLMMEPGDLSSEDRKRIIWFHTHLEKWTHYELLRVNRSAEPKEIRRAYHQRSKEWHPDRFRFAPNQGSFEGLLRKIFERINAAYRLLSDAEQRKAYDADNVLMASEDDITEMLAQQRREEREKYREVEAKERRLRRNPMRARNERAKELVEEAMKLRQDGEILRALGVAQTAEAFDSRTEHKELVDKLKKDAAELRVAPVIRRGTHYESLTNWTEALEEFEKAVKIAPDYGPARIRLAFNMVMGKRDPHVASTHASKGVHLMPDEPEAHFVLGLCYDKLGKDKAAIRALEKALALKPNYKEAKKRLRELKWWI